MSDNFTGVEQEFEEDQTAFPIDASEVLTKASITLGVEHHILRPDEWLILRTIDGFQGLIHIFLGAWILGLINIFIKLLMEHFSDVKIQLLDDIEIWGALVPFFLWLIGFFLYHGRFNQKWKITQVDRQYLVDKIDSKLRLKFKRNER